MKKLIAVILSVVMAFCCLVPAFAADNETSEEYPVVIIRGMDFGGLYQNLGTENEVSCTAGVNADNIVRAICKAFLKGITSLSVDAFVESLAVSMGDIFAPLACDKNGNSAPNVSVPKYEGSFDKYYGSTGLGNGNEHGLLKTAIDRYGAENVYYYTYDWRLDPYELASEVNDVVETAKADHSVDKVNLVCCSMGGVVTDAYIYRYGWDSLGSCVFLSSTFQGTHCTTDLFSKKAKIIEPALAYMLKGVSDDKIVNVLIDLLIKSGALSTVCRIGNKLIEKYKDTVYDLTMRDTFATMPSLWAIILPDQLDECIEAMYPTDELKAEYSGIIAKAKRMNTVMKDIDSLLLEAAADGCRISVVATYNLTCVPFYENAGLQGDGTLESDLMLGGATVSIIGETLGDDYVPANPEKLSPDRQVDLSNCLFPESTWAIKDASHVPAQYGSECAEFICDLLSSPVQPTVDNMEGYSQFMVADANYNFINK